MHQIASWLRHVSQDDAKSFAALESHLAEGVLPGLQQMKLEKVSEGTRILKFEFQGESPADTGTGMHKYWLTFDQLSDGQRNLVALYSILCAAIRPDSTVCLDEPVSFVALREIQPWLTAIQDKVQDSCGQCLLISHHPELMDYLAANHGVLFTRDDGGPTRVKRFESTREEMLIPSVLIARGWEE
jgi:ABC-type dipeptide/oligopeptide/nickel transport system ATPase subunit